MRLCCCTFGIAGAAAEEELFMGGYLRETAPTAFIARCENNVCAATRRG